MTGSISGAAAMTVGRGSKRDIANRADRWSVILAFAVALFVPLWFFGANAWNPEYVPVRPWVWAVPGIGALLYVFLQFWLLLNSAGRSDEIGMSDTVVSLIAFMSCFGTLIALSILAYQGNYNLGAFQSVTISLITVAALGELVFTAWVRYLVNRRYFASVPDGN